jgi:hypothetical protein
MLDNVVDLDDSGRNPGLDDIELRFIRREGEPVRPVDVAGCNRGSAAAGVEPVDVGGKFGRGHVALAVAGNAERLGGAPFFAGLGSADKQKEKPARRRGARALRAEPAG